METLFCFHFIVAYASKKKFEPPSCEWRPYDYKNTSVYLSPSSGIAQ